MNPMLAAVTACTLIAAVMVTVAGVIKVPEQRGTPDGPLTRRIKRMGSTSPAKRRRWVAVAASIVAGALVWLFTGWVLAIVIIPAAVAGLPYLLQTSNAAHEIERLDAMSDWTRNLAGVLTVGVGIEQALSTSLATCPPTIRTEVAGLVARLRARWDTETALRRFADDLDDATGDLIAGALILGARQRGSNLSDVLQGLATAVAEDVKVRRDVAAEQAKPRSRSRMITVITAGALLFLLLTPYSEPYRTSPGLIFLLLYLLIYGGCLFWLRKTTDAKPQPRILRSDRSGITGVPA